MDATRSAAQPVVRPLPITPAGHASDREGVLAQQTSMQTLHGLRNAEGVPVVVGTSPRPSADGASIAPRLQSVCNQATDGNQDLAYAAAVGARIQQSRVGLGLFGIVDEAVRGEGKAMGPREQAFLAGLARAAMTGVESR